MKKNNEMAGRFGKGSVGNHLRGLGLAFLGLLSQSAFAGAAQDKAFFDTLYARCQNPVDLGSPLFNLCDSAFPGVLAGGSFVAGAVSTNIGSSGALGSFSQSTAEQKRKDAKKQKGGGASADFRLDRLGFLISAQTGETARKPTDLENGFDSDLSGLMLGVDYSFSDRLLIGLNVGDSDNRAVFREGAGDLRSKMTTATVYLGYAPVDAAYFGAYAGTGRIRNSGSKKVLFGGVSGTASSNTSGTQDILGVSGGYSWDLGSSARLGGYLNVDSARTRLDGYTEAGSTGLELIQPGQSIDSLTSTLGLRISAASASDWGTMLPEFRFAKVREYRNDARTLTTALAVDPTTRFQVSTDAPDRNYYLTGAGVNFEVGNRTRWFVDYEKRGGHSYLSTWAASIGVIVGF